MTCTEVMGIVTKDGNSNKKDGINQDRKKKGNNEEIERALESMRMNRITREGEEKKEISSKRRMNGMIKKRKKRKKNESIHRSIIIDNWRAPETKQGR